MVCAVPPLDCTAIMLWITMICLACLNLPAAFAQSSSPQILPQGRFGGKVDVSTGLIQLPVLFSWPASSIYASFVSDSVYASLSAIPATATYDVNSRFAFFVDEQQVGVESTTLRQTSIRWNATGLGAGALLASTPLVWHATLKCLLNAGSDVFMCFRDSQFDHK